MTGAMPNNNLEPVNQPTPDHSFPSFALDFIEEGKESKPN
jgi:hypothetical protein